jgi:LysR family transcriptional regulator (chromosome initiation inhibitor)
MLDYSSLVAVAAVIREGSFERAALALHVTASAVSQRVKLFEERIGAVLVVRGQPCMPTELGARLCRHAELVGMLEADLGAGLSAGATTRAAGAATVERPTLRVAVNADSLATWFIAALARFAEQENALLDVAIDDQDYTAEWLRRGRVVAAVGAHGTAVPGCRSVRLGALRYLATASPEFVRRHFAAGVNAETLRRAPSLVFNHKDQLQARWLRRVCRQTVAAPRHWLPSTQAFVDATVAGLGWGMNPAPLVDALLASGRLVELVPGQTLTVPLYWQYSRLKVPMLERLTRIVQTTARERL